MKQLILLFYSTRIQNSEMTIKLEIAIKSTVYCKLVKFLKHFTQTNHTLEAHHIYQKRNLLSTGKILYRSLETCRYGRYHSRTC